MSTTNRVLPHAWHALTLLRTYPIKQGEVVGLHFQNFMLYDGTYKSSGIDRKLTVGYVCGWIC